VRDEGRGRGFAASVRDEGCGLWVVGRVDAARRESGTRDDRSERS
jgi:hypothetical protein